MHRTCVNECVADYFLYRFIFERWSIPPSFQSNLNGENTHIIPFLIKPRQKLPPLLLDVPVVEDIVGVWARGGRFGEQLHVGFTRCVACLAVVARGTGTDHILPYVRTLARAGDYVVERQVLGFGAAVLAAEAVAIEYGSPGKTPSDQRPLDHVDKPNHGRNGHTPRHCGDMVVTIY